MCWGLKYFSLPSACQHSIESLPRTPTTSPLTHSLYKHSSLTLVFTQLFPLHVFFLTHACISLPLLYFSFHPIFTRSELFQSSVIVSGGIGAANANAPSAQFDMLHVSRCNFVGGTGGVSESNWLPSCSSDGLTGEFSIICHQNEHNEKRTGIKSPFTNKSSTSAQKRIPAVLQ